MDDLVSIILPMHNSEKYLEEAIRSVISQTYENWELLIIDDASTDNSLSIARYFESCDTRIHVLINDTPMGCPAIPRNVGIRRAKGRFIAFLDSDDVWLPCKLEEQLNFFTGNRIAVVYSDYEKMSEDGTRCSRIVNAPKSTNYKKMLKGNAIGNLTGIYDVSKAGKVYFMPIHHEDYAMWLSILKRGYIAVNTGTVTAIYRLHGNSISSKKLSLLSWQWNIYMNVENLGYVKSIFYYVNYACRAFRKRMI